MAGRALFILVVCVLAVSGGPAGAQSGLITSDDPTMPGGITGDRIGLIVERINNGDTEAMQRFYENHLSEEYREEMSLEYIERGARWIAESTGGVDFHGIRTFDPPQGDRTVAVFRDRICGNWWALTLVHGEDPEGPVSGLRMGMAAVPSEVMAQRLTEAELVQELGPIVEKVCADGIFGGTVLIAQGDHVIYQYACGEASKRFRAPIDMDTKFNIGSMNKMFTATACAQLVERGLLSFDDPISAYVDTTWLPVEITEKITVHHLLSHTSGLGNFFNEEFEQGAKTRFREIDDFKVLVQGDTLLFEPGTDWKYSNTGMHIAGVVIESVTGQSYYDYVRENIYEPAGMTNSGHHSMECPVENLAIGYYRPDDGSCEWKNNYYERLIAGSPAGGGYSTAPDLHRFSQAMVSETLVSGETLKTMWTDYREGDRDYGYGFILRESLKGRIIGHDGGHTGIEAHYDVYLGTGHTVVVLTNIDEGAWALHMKIGELMERLE